MNNELIKNRSWWSINWKWFLPTSIILFIIGFFLLIMVATDANVADFAQAYTDNSLYEKALEKVKLNQRAKEILGEIEPIDKLAIVEGSIKYSNDNNSVETTIRIKGNKAKGKMDISADKNGTEWEYKKINIRIKDSTEEIDILK
jgi:hypothetical protein